MNILSMIRRWWCRLMHREDMMPMHGKVVCAVCLTARPVRWERYRESELVVDWPIVVEERHER